MCGDGAKSVMAAQQALRLEPAYSMALLMLDLATSGLSPDRWPEGTAQLGHAAGTSQPNNVRRGMAH